MYKLSFFVPKTNKEKVKEALFEIGVGRYNNYDKCSWEVLGIGQFRALDNADPFIGKKGEVALVQEYKVEMICKDELIKEAIKVLKQAHPYEEVAYEAIKLEDL
jgi:hypothetical protein